LKKIKNPKEDIEVKFNSTFKSNRIIIENLFAFCKKFKILSETLKIKKKNLNMSLIHHDNLWRSVLIIYNLFFCLRK
jgi:hypothetical protein